MTENEARLIKWATDTLEGKLHFPLSPLLEGEGKKEARTIIESIVELNQYREIGTVDECRSAMEKQKPKIADIWGDGYDDDGNMIYDMYDCPNCGETYEIGYQDYKYCPECGQAIDWSQWSNKLEV